MIATARMTRHAVERCKEMGISTKVAKLIMRSACLTRPSGTNGSGQEVRIAVSDAPGCERYAVVYVPSRSPLVLSVVFRTVEKYQRKGATFAPVADR